jgi:GT2 family glycosyltransferase/glycosyltransferase involved in cell wall biosynthesis
VDIIVPIYGAADDLARCLASVDAHTDFARHGLILVVDGPQDEAVEAVVRSAPMAQLLRNESRRGFVGSVNRGMAASIRDVVLLNSDTIVTPRWLEKLIAAGASANDIGTVTPLSNNGSLCSVPRTLTENFLPTGFDATAFAALIERVSARAYVRIPTAVGFCMYIRRALIEAIGAFDEQRFGLGYGEENDFCMRALARGWVHIADDATFVQHAGGRSFSAERAALQRRARRTLARLHPDYDARIARFIADDPLATVRARIVDALREYGRAGTAHRGATTDKPAIAATGNARGTRQTRGPRRVVHVLHGWPPFAVAGTELYAHWLVQRQLQQREVSVYARLEDPARAQNEAVEFNDRGARVRLITNNFLQRSPIARNIHSMRFARDFAAFLRDERPDLVHIHHLAGHTFALAGVAHRLGLPLVYQVQDWWAMCARANLLDTSARRCSGPGLAKCARCAPLTAIAPAPLWNLALHVARRAAARRALSMMDAYVMGSEFIRNDYLRAGLFAPGKSVHVLPYGIDVPAVAVQRPPTARPVRFGFVGSKLPHKGLQVAQAAFAGIDPALATLNLWGSAGTRFDESDKTSVFAAMDVLIMPSVGLESFGLAAREAMASGVPVIATYDGALTEMAAEFFPSGDATALRAIVLRLAQNPQQVDELARCIVAPKSADTHAEEIESVYAEVLKARR